jgi:hypothetical protein
MSDIGQAQKVTRDRVRRAAHRQSLLLAKARQRDARASGFGMYRLVDEATSPLVAVDHVTGYGYDHDYQGYLDRGLC